MSDTESLRLSFCLERITTLFVGESPPHGGTFFYKGDSLLHNKLRESFGGRKNFLSEFKAKGFYLDDLVLYPINQIKKERKEHRKDGIASLAQRMANYRPDAVVVLVCGIEPMVVAAMREAGLSRIPLHVVPFPSHGNQQRFKAKMAEIIPKLPVSNSSG